MASGEKSKKGDGEGRKEGKIDYELEEEGIMREITVKERKCFLWRVYLHRSGCCVDLGRWTARMFR